VRVLRRRVLRLPARAGGCDPPLGEAPCRRLVPLGVMAPERRAEARLDGARAARAARGHGPACYRPQGTRGMAGSGRCRRVRHSALAPPESIVALGSDMGPPGGKK